MLMPSSAIRPARSLVSSQQIGAAADIGPTRAIAKGSRLYMTRVRHAAYSVSEKEQHEQQEF